MKKLIMGLLLLSSVCIAENKVFYVYEDSGSRMNHFIPSGWMGSTKSLKINSAYKVAPKSGKSCIQIKYLTTLDTETTWAGIYWQYPVNNWGDKPNGIDLTGYKKLTFWAKGEGYLQTIGMGGISGQAYDGDSANATIEGVDLTPEWKQYTIDLKGLDLSHVIGGFYFATSADYNEKDVTIYLDEIRYE
jgi:hypothetical protein